MYPSTQLGLEPSEQIPNFVSFVIVAVIAIVVTVAVVIFFVLRSKRKKAAELKASQAGDAIDVEAQRVEEAQNRRLGEAMFQAAKDGDVGAYRKLRELAANQLWRKGEDAPEGWQEMVAKCDLNPSLDDFQLDEDDFNYGDLRLRAATALRTNDIVEAKIVLAYANEDDDWRDEIGALAGKLAMMVEAAWATGRRIEPLDD